MKKVNLTYIHDKRQQRRTVYEVTLGNGKTTEFSNLKSAKQFITAASEFLTDALFEANEYLIDAYRMSRELWLHFKPYSDNHYSIERVFKNLKISESKLDKVAIRDGDYTNVSAFQALIDGLIKIISALGDISLRQKQTRQFILLRMSVNKVVNAQRLLHSIEAFPRKL